MYPDRSLIEHKVEYWDSNYDKSMNEIAPTTKALIQRSGTKKIESKVHASFPDLIIAVAMDRYRVQRHGCGCAQLRVRFLGLVPVLYRIPDPDPETEGDRYHARVQACVLCK